MKLRGSTIAFWLTMGLASVTIYAAYRAPVPGPPPAAPDPMLSTVPVRMPDGTMRTWTPEGGSRFAHTLLVCGSSGGGIFIDGHDVCKEAR